MQGNNYFAYVNGTFAPYSDASLPINDRGLKFGDGVYETIRVENGAMFSWDKHLERLKTSLQLLKITVDISGLFSICSDLIHKNRLTRGTVRIMVTRGTGGTGYLPGHDNSCGIVVEALPLPAIKDRPVDLWVSSWNKIPASCLPAAAKTMQGLSSTLARLEAEENKCFEAILLSTGSHICEGSSSNIFWVKNGKLSTPSLEAGILAGTTRDHIIELWPEDVSEGIYTMDDLKTADEAFVTNVVWTALPARALMPYNITFKSNDVCAKVKKLLEQKIMEDTSSIITSYK